MNKDYFKFKEDEDFKKLEDFNSLLKLTELGTAPQKHYYDASGYTSNNPTQEKKLITIEIKQRNQTIIIDNNEFKISGQTIDGKSYIDTTSMINSEKIALLLANSYTDNSTPLIVNFLNDDYIVVYNLKKLTIPLTYKEHSTYSRGYERQQQNIKLGLSLKDAFIYSKNNEGKWHQINDKR